MADNIRPSDLNEIIAIYPRAPCKLLVSSRSRALEVNLKSTLDRALLFFPARQQPTIADNTAILAARIRPIR
jgi:hypothetical protein